MTALIQQNKSAAPGPFQISGMAAANRDYEAPMRAFLAGLTAAPQPHARFMNMLSMLEHTGSRKIMLSQMNGVLTEDSLKHLAEEARHAYFFKRQAERIAKKPLDGYTDENTMCRVSALMYFGRLDAGISARVTKNDAYPWVSMIVELRACWLYHIYNDVLAASDVKLSLKSLLAEEDLHLAEMFEMVGENTDLLRELSAYETSLFAKLWTNLCTENALPKAA